MNVTHNSLNFQSSTNLYTTVGDLQVDCTAHMDSNDIPCISVHTDGKIHRFPIGSKKNKNGWYIAWDGISIKGNPYLICIYGSWKMGEKFEYRSWSENSTFDEEERIELQRRLKEKREAAEKAIKVEQDEVAKECRSIWEAAAIVHPSEHHLEYLRKKRVKNYGLRFGDNEKGYPSLIIPLRNAVGEIRSLQYISVGQSGEIYKTFHTGGEKKGNHYVIGSINKDQPFYVCEGYATGASAHEAINKPVVVAFDCNNLAPVIESLRKVYPDSKITILADDDNETQIAKGFNPGKDAAEAAAKQYRCDVIIPEFGKDFRLPDGKLPSDFNDLHVGFGLEEVKKQILQKKSYLNPIDIGSFLSLKIPPRRLLLDPWLPAQGLTMIHTKRGVGKTYTALSIAYAIASGGNIFKWNAPEAKKVLYVDGEMPAPTMQERLANIALASDKHPPDPSYFKLITPDLLEAEIRDISTLEGQMDINEHLNDIDLIVIDNLSTLIRSGRENESESWLPVQEWALKLRKAGKSILFVHHAGKGGQQRGTSKKEDVLDTVINLKHPNDYSPQDGARFEIHFEKARGFDGDAAKPFEVALNSKDEKLKWSFKDVEDKNFQLAIDMYSNDMSMTDIANELSVNKSTVSRWIAKAKNEGRIKK